MDKYGWKQRGTGKNCTEETEKDRNRQKCKEKDRKGHKQTETDINRQRPTKQTGKKLEEKAETHRNMSHVTCHL